MRRVLFVGIILGVAASSAFAQDSAAIEAGGQVYEQHCASCHGEQLRSPGAMPDLRDVPDDRTRFDKVVLEGRNQMPAWEGIVSPQELDQLWAYVRSRAR